MSRFWRVTEIPDISTAHSVTEREEIALIPTPSMTLGGPAAPLAAEPCYIIKYLSTPSLPHTHPHTHRAIL